jgi:hypothetical protein
VSHAGSSVIVPRLRAGFVVLLLLLGYSVGSGVLYLLWSRFVGWPAVAEEHEMLLRLVHLLPALTCSIVVGGIGGAISPTKSLLPVVFLGLGIAVSHYMSYSIPSRTASADIVAAIAESLILFAIAFASYAMLVGRRSR